MKADFSLHWLQPLKIFIKPSSNFVQISLHMLRGITVLIGSTNINV
jgi:hypothetical protein